MEKTTALKIIFALAICGVLFAGYLSFSKLILQTCPLNEPCASFLGLPTCIYGFVMFLSILIFSAIGAFRKNVKHSCWLKSSMIVALLGIIFSGYFTIKELFFTTCLGGNCSYSLGLPSCSYGLLMYIGIFVISAIALSGCCKAKKGKAVKAHASRFVRPKKK
jgi:hypothetical protein